MMLEPRAIPPRNSLPSGRAGGAQWQFEPKWDGFRCLAFRTDDEVYLQSKAQQPLARYFPEIVEALSGLRARRCVLDGELAVPAGEGFSFDALLQRVHPAASRVTRLSRETPAIFVVFDLLADARGRSLLERPLRERRAALEAFAESQFTDERLRLSPATRQRKEAQRWLAQSGATLDGVVAKRLDLPYRSGERDGMSKIKRFRSADCVVGGFRYGQGSKLVGSLLLGLYDAAGLLHHVGFTSSLASRDKPALTRQLERLIEPPGFTGDAPGGPSRWSSGRETVWQPLRPELVVEVGYDHVSERRFRHGTRLLRWRPDKAPAQCTMDQIAQSSAGLAKLLAQVR